MITTSGKNIIAKYLLNQAPEFASHIAIGVGDKAYPTGSSATFLEDAKSLEFEVARVPILSKGLLNEDGQEKIVFKAELPIEQRFQITEIGIYPGGSNFIAENFDSKVVSTFDNSEPWKYSNNLNSSSVVNYINDIPLSESVIGNIDTLEEDIIPGFAFVNSNSPIFEYSLRSSRGESPRYLNKGLLVVGNYSELLGASASSSIIDTSSSASYYLENNSINLNLGKNLPTDQIKLAFSVVSVARTGTESLAPEYVKIRLEFLNNTAQSLQKAFVDIIVLQSEIEDMRYKVVTKPISDFTTTENFSWSAINSVRIYTSTHDNDNNPSNAYYIFYDGIRFENISSYNPLYGLVAAEYVKTIDESPILKKENSTSYIEYRFGIGII